jgi:hypothetical protein
MAFLLILLIFRDHGVFDKAEAARLAAGAERAMIHPDPV